MRPTNIGREALAMAVNTLLTFFGDSIAQGAILVVLRQDHRPA
jgi:hypothetical protein